MKFSDLIYISIQNFKNRKSRVFFTILGVSVAIAVVLSLVSFGYGLQRNLLKQITTADSLLTLDAVSSDPNLIILDQTMIKRIQAIPDVERVSAQAVFSGQASYGGVFSGVSLNVVDPDSFTLDGTSPSAGKFFTDTDEGDVVINSVVAQLFHLTPADAVGKSVSFSVFVPATTTQGAVIEVPSNREFTIVGVIDSQGSTGDIYINTPDFTYAPITTYQTVKVKVSNVKDIDAVRTELVNLGFLVSSLSDVVTQANKIFGAVQIALGIFGVFALIVAAIGLVNTMTISLLERTNEIGIMRAIGASPGDIRKIFLGESILIGFIGGVSGIVLGVVGSQILNWGFDLLSKSYGGTSVQLFAYPFWFIIFIIVLSTVVGFAGGIWPAQRAASMNPLKALRYK